jgi:hypothetical protein
VYGNGVDWGLSPVTKELAVGNYTVKVEEAGYNACMVADVLYTNCQFVAKVTKGVTNVVSVIMKVVRTVGFNSVPGGATVQYRVYGAATWLTAAGSAPLMEGATYEIKYTLSGYKTLRGYIEVASGAVTCIVVEEPVGAACGSTTNGIRIDPAMPLVVNGYLTKSDVAAPFCDWVTSKGGASAVSFSDLQTLVNMYLGKVTPAWAVKFADLQAAVDYYLDRITQGNAKSGCTFT